MNLTISKNKANGGLFRTFRSVNIDGTLLVSLAKAIVIRAIVLSIIHEGIVDVILIRGLVGYFGYKSEQRS